MMIKQLKKTIFNTILEQDYHSPVSSDLSSKTVVVTGASRGVGKAIANALLNEGAELALISRNIDEIKGNFKDSDRVLLISANLTNEAEVNSAIKRILERFGKIDVLVNNAGINIHKSLENVTKDEFESVINLNLTAIFMLCKNVVPILKTQKFGLIINVGSKISHNTNVGPNKVTYATSKYALEGFSLALNKELQPFGIRVSCLMPATINTFVSKKAKIFMSPYDIASVIIMMIKFEKINFESMIFSSSKQNI